MSGIDELSAYAQGDKNADYSDLSTLEPSLFVNSQSSARIFNEWTNVEIYTPVRESRLHASPNGSAGQSSSHSEESFEDHQQQPMTPVRHVMPVAYPHYWSQYSSAPYYVPPQNHAAPVMHYHNMQPTPYFAAPKPSISTPEVVKTERSKKSRKSRRDPNEPQKPVSAYALFFRDTQAAIKGQNPNASFGEVSKIVASMWDNLDNEQKNSYKQRTEAAKKDYLKQLAAYRANLLTSNTNIDSTTLAHAQFMSVQQRLKQQQCMPSTSTANDGVALAMTNTKQNTEAVRRMKEATEQVSSGVSLADLIAAPTQQQTRIATTTLTVPQHHLNQHNNAQWSGNEQFRPNDGLVQRCRDVFALWGQPSQQQQSGGEVQSTEQQQN